MAEQNFAADCSQCFGLCCTALSFERSDQFGHDKLAGQMCQYLDDSFRCRIHARREELGYEGCEAFDCLGAGQRASAAFASQNWQRDGAVARRLYARFSLLMRLQEMRQALETAANLDLPEVLHIERVGIMDRLGGAADSVAPDIDQAANAVLIEAKDFLKRLAPELTV